MKEVPPFSEKLMMHCIYILNGFSITGNAFGTFFTLRNDISMKNVLIAKDIFFMDKKEWKLSLNMGGLKNLRKWKTGWKSLKIFSIKYRAIAGVLYPASAATATGFSTFFITFSRRGSNIVLSWTLPGVATAPNTKPFLSAAA